MRRGSAATPKRDHGRLRKVRTGLGGRSSNPSQFRPSRSPRETGEKRTRLGKATFVSFVTSSTRHPRSALFPVKSMARKSSSFFGVGTQAGRAGWRLWEGRQGGASRTCRTRLVHGSLSGYHGDRAHRVECFPSEEGRSCSELRAEWALPPDHLNLDLRATAAGHQIREPQLRLHE